MVFFNPVAILGFKKDHFRPWAGIRKKIIEVQDKKRKKMGILGDFTFWSFGATSV